MTMFFKTLKCTFRKQFLEFTRYPNFILKSLFYTPITILLPYFYTIKLFIGTQSLDNKEVFTLLIGSILWNFVYFSVIETLNIINRELNTGSLENIYVSPASKIAWLMGSSFVPSAMFIISLGVIALIVYLFFNINTPINLILIFYAIVFSFISTWAMCLFVFILNLWLKRIFNIVNFMLDVLAIFVGILYPISFLSEKIRWISYLIPTTYCIELIRGGFTSSIITTIMIKKMIILGLLSFLLFSASIIFFNIFEKRLKRYGNFLKY